MEVDASDHIKISISNFSNNVRSSFLIHINITSNFYSFITSPVLGNIAYYLMFRSYGMLKCCVISYGTSCGVYKKNTKGEGHTYT